MNEEDRGQCRTATVFCLPGTYSHTTEIPPRFVKFTDVCPHLLIHVGINYIKIGWSVSLVILKLDVKLEGLWEYRLHFYLFHREKGMPLAEKGRHRKLTVDHIHNVEKDLIFWTVPHGSRTMGCWLRMKFILWRKTKMFVRRLTNLIRRGGLPDWTKTNWQNPSMPS